MEGEYFTSDLILLNSSEPKGIAYIETKSLDGETNMKHKISNRELTQICENEGDTCRFKANVNCEMPND
jgi:magnesium-transporting ATPase (P-type)